MHHAPAGPPPAVRLAALVRRSRLLPLTAAGLVVAGIVLAGPPPAGGLATGTAAHTSPSEGGRELVPATGDGWTQDGRAPARTDEGPAAGPAPRSPDAATAPGGTAPSGTAPSGTAPSGTVQSSTGSSSTGSSSGGPSSGGPSSGGPSSGGPTESPVSAPRSSPAAVSSAGTASTSPRVERDGRKARSSPSPSPSPSAPAPAPGTVVAGGGADQALAAVDAARTAAGCEALTVDADLTQDAIAHSSAMRDQGALLPPPGTGAVSADLTDPAAVAAGWLADDRGALTDCALVTAGVGVVDGWWTLLLA